MTIAPPSIHVVHASDAPQHTGELKTILQRLKAEHRIVDFSAMDISTDPDSLFFKNEDHQGIIVLLTNEIERTRAKIESLINNITFEKQDIKLIEIIVDNLPYRNNFISFPQDLMPIRTRDDMNLIWNGIENDLKMLFPMPEQEQPLSEVVQGKDSKILLKVFLVAIMTAVLATIFLVGLADNNYISGDALPFLTPIAFAFLIPILIYFRDRKDLEWIAFSFEGQKQIQVVNWKQLLIRTGIAFFAMCLAIRIFASESFFKSASVLGVAAILPLVLYRMKRLASAEQLINPILDGQ
jgi:uncharacterized membrane protein